MVCISRAISSLSQFAVFLCVFAVLPAEATDELFIHVLSAGIPVSDAEVVVDGVLEGRTSRDGSLLTSVTGVGSHTLSIDTDQGSVSARFTSGSGQLVDAIVNVDLGEVFVDVYSQTEGIRDRKAAAEGTLNIRVTQGNVPATQESIYIAGLGMSLQTDSEGEARVTLARGRYRTQVAEQTANLRVVGGLTRTVKLEINETRETMQLASARPRGGICGRKL